MKEALHRAMHRLPGVPAHEDRPAGHQGRSLRNRRPRVRQPRVLVAWQRRIGRLFGQELP
ncbi:hypothetical protein [Actinocrispum sp. NPDC049592]|uniref:hypothetical protein n=1 Tax=Actinocrispum sp. NPDC049592 TaxID=3154835 RepID=UPI00341F3987